MTQQSATEPSPEDLLREWETGEERGLRPGRLQELREPLMAVTGLHIPHRRSALGGAWYDQFKSQITRKLREAVEAEE